MNRCCEDLLKENEELRALLKDCEIIFKEKGMRAEHPRGIRRLIQAALEIK